MIGVNDFSRNQKMSVLFQNTIQQVQKEGFLCLYRGLKPLLARDVCYSAIYWSVYERLHSYAEKHGFGPIWQNFFAGSIGGMTSSAIVTPFDVVKTRHQVMHVKETLFTCMKGIVKVIVG
jgi:hypothetical protein